MNRQAQCCDQAAQQDKLHPSFATHGGEMRGCFSDSILKKISAHRNEQRLFIWNVFNYVLHLTGQDCTQVI